jgi:peptidyl-tRNA hydrolase
MEMVLYCFDLFHATAGIGMYLVRDAGHTQVLPGSKTVLAIG